MSEIQNIPAQLICRGQNDRTVFDPVRITELAESIRKNGLIQPPTVRPLLGGFEIVAGECRYRAMSYVLQWTEIPCIVVPLSDEEAAAVMLAENTSRNDLNPIDEARAYQVRIERFGWTVEQTASSAGASADRVQRRLSLLSLVPDLQFMVSRGHLPIGHAEAMTRLDGQRQAIALRMIRDSAKLPPLSAFRQFVSGLLEQQDQTEMFELAEYYELQMQKMELPRRGAKARPNVPTRADLPAPEVRGSDSAGDIVTRWIETLQAAGKEAEAGAVGTLFTALVQSNFMTVPL